MRPRHWKNLGEGGHTVFFTTTVLDFVHAFAKPELKDLMAASFLNDCAWHKANLHAFVVMPHHIHSLVTLTQNLTASKFVGLVKGNSGRRIKPLLDAQTLKGFDQQRGLNTRQFWMRGFKSIVVSGGAVYSQKFDYIHWNPVKAGYCELESQYRWSSAWAWEDGGYVVDHDCLDAAKLCSVFAPHGLSSTFRPRNLDQ